MKPLHSLIATTILRARILARLLVIVSFLFTGYAQELTSDATTQRNQDQKPFQFETNFKVVETKSNAGVLFKDGFTNWNFQFGQLPKKFSIKMDPSVVTYQRERILFSPSLHWQSSPSRASGSKRLYKFLTGAALTGVGIYFLATSESEKNFRNDGFFSIYRVTPEGRTCIENCPSWHTDRDWKFAAGVTSLLGAALFFLWGI